MRILVTGPQGSGKTTQARLLAGYLKVPFIGIGEALRRIAQCDTEEGLKIKEALSSGDLVDDGIVSDVARKRFSESDCVNGFVADGYPRTLDQQNLFNPDYDLVIYLDIDDEEVTSRLLKRGRGDDTPELIVQRLAIYHQETKALIDYYKNRGNLEKIDGTKSIEEIQDNIRKLVNG